MAELNTSPFPIAIGKGWLAANCLGAAACLYLLRRLWLRQAVEGYTFMDGWEILVLWGIFMVGNTIWLLAALVVAMRCRVWVPTRAPLICFLVWGAVGVYFSVR
jgi:hypothetical protein